MKSKIKCCTRNDFIKEYSKNNNKRQNVLFLKSQDLYISSIINKEKLKSINFDGKEKRKTKNITTSGINSKLKQNIKSNCMKKQNISLCSNIKSKYNTSKKKNNIDNNYTSVSLIKKIYIDEIKENINLMNISEKNKKPTILAKKINSYHNSIKKGKVYNNNILFQTINKSLIHTNLKSQYNNIYSNSFLNDKLSNNINQSIKISINYNSKNNSNRKINTSRRNKKISNIIKSDIFLAKKLIFSNHNMNSAAKEKGQKKKINNTKKDNSSKLTNISSSDKNEISKKSPVDIPKKSYDLKNENFLKKSTFLERQVALKMTSEIYENDTQDYESKFLNYELGISDKVSTINNLDETIKKKEAIKNECEKPVEEIEKKAKEIYNSEYKYKEKKSEKKIINNSSLNHINLNNDIEEFKEGEEIQNIFTLYINKKMKINNY